MTKPAPATAPICPYCNIPAIKTDGAAIYPHRPDLADKVFWRCERCNVCVAQIPGFPGYVATSDGCIWSSWNSRWGMTCPWRKLASALNRATGYFALSLRAESGHKTRPVHVLILLSFVGPRPTPKAESCHGDGDKSHNGLVNLRWDTRAGNVADRDAHGKTVRGEHQKAAKLCDAKVRAIRTRMGNGASATALAREYGVHVRNIYRANDGKTWRHVI